jgi:3-hydroxybutyrate dehydrogenase
VRAALVTGAASGIGRAIAGRLERDGAQVLSVDLEPDPDGPGEPFAADLTTREGNRDAVAAALERFGRLDTVVPNAGFQHVAPVEEFPEDRWEAMIALLLTSPFLHARAAWPALRESGDGRFVAIASVHGLVASPFKSAYVSAKHGVLGLVKTLALEGAGDGIVRCEVSDDGRGGADLSRGTGILGLRDRAEAAGGTLTLTSPPGQGTVVSAALPVSR